MITLYLVRHGETNYNKENRVQGHEDSLLTDFGKQQAAALATAFESTSIDQMYASPLTRASDTANAIASNHDDLDVTPLDEFKELHCGDFQGMLLDEIRESRWEEWQHFLSSPNVAPSGGESMNQLYVRVSKAMEMILNGAGEDETIVCVSHAGVVRMSMAYLMNVQVGAAVNFGLSNGSIARLINKHGRWTLLKWNDTEHLGALEGEVKFVL